MDFNQIQELIRLVHKHKLTEFTLKEGEFKLVIRSQGQEGTAVGQPVVIPAALVPAPVAVAAPAPAPAAPKAETPAAPTPAPAPAAEENNTKLVPIKSPMVGTFYRAAGQDKPPFVKVGDIIDEHSTVCIIEAMKLFNEIESEIKGRIVKVLVEDSSPVEYDQPLFLVEPV